MSKEIFERLSNEIYVLPGFVTVQGVLDSEKNFEIKPLIDAVNAFSNDIYNLSEEDMKTLLSGIRNVYDMQAAASGRLGVLKGPVHEYIEKCITEFKMKENIFFKLPTNDIRDVFSVDDVKEIFKISKVYYNDDINKLIKKNLPKLVDEYLAKEISGVYIFTRMGVQLLLDDAKADTKDSPVATDKKPEVKVVPVVKEEKPVIALDSKVMVDIPSKDSYYLKSSSMEHDLSNFMISDIDPFTGGNKNVAIPVHKVDDYRRVLLNLIWNMQLYMGLPYFFDENVNDREVCACQTKNLVIFHAVGLTRLLKTYYTYFYRKAAVFSLNDFINGAKDMGYLPDKHTVCYNGKEVKDVLVFDKNVIAKYIFDNRLFDMIPDYERCVDWWKTDSNSNAFNAVGASNEFIDLSRKHSLIDRKFIPTDNSKAVIKIDYPTPLNKSKGKENTPIANDSKKVVAAAPVVQLPKPNSEFEKVVYNSKKRIFLSDIVKWVVDNSDTLEQENIKIKEVYDAISKYNPKLKLYHYISELTFAIRQFDGVRNPVIFG